MKMTRCMCAQVTGASNASVRVQVVDLCDKCKANTLQLLKPQLGTLTGGSSPPSSGLQVSYRQVSFPQDTVLTCSTKACTLHTLAQGLPSKGVIHHSGPSTACNSACA